MALFTIYTIGSSTRQAQEFRTLVHCCHIATLVGVRTFPYSKRFPNFSKASLEEMISTSGLRYVYLGRDLGGYRRGWSVVHILDQVRTWQPQSVQGS